MRKRTGNRLVILLVWSSYFLAKWAASFALGLITSTQSSKHGENSDVYAFWASFLLLHHGGPDTISTFEENELWIRHLVSLINQVGFTFYVLLQTLPKNNLWLPTSLNFFVGIIKYVERTRSLYLVSWGTFRESMLTKPDPGPDYANTIIKESKSAFYCILYLPDNRQLDDFDVVKYGYHFFKIFKGLIVDLVSHKDLQESRVCFTGRTPEDALEVLEVELNFIYEILYTKLFAVHNRRGYFFRLLTFASVLVSLGIFFFLDCKNGLNNFDIRVTYILLLVALSLEAIAIFKLIFSDWTVASLDKTNANSFVLTIFERYLKFKRSRWSRPPCKGMKPNTNPIVLWTVFSRYVKFRSPRGSTCSKDDSGNKFSKRATSALLRRWSESVAGFNLITYCLEQLSKKSNEENDQWCLGIYKKTTHLLHHHVRKYVVEPLGAQQFLDELKYAPKDPLREDLWKFIFDELLQKSKEADQPEHIKKISSARGAYVLKEYCKKNLGGKVLLFETLKTDYIENVTFDESLLLWHIATELCYHGSEIDHETKAQPDEQELGYNGSQVDHKFISKLISEYMLYFLVMKPTMMSDVASISDIRYRDTCAEAKRFFRKMGLGPKNKEEDACENLLAVNTDVKPIYIKGDKSKSILFDACILAKELQKLEGIEKWKVISKVWVEMLSYASNHCRLDAHAQQVSRGGHLISLVWLLMAHFGLVDQYVFTADYGDAKLIVEK
ncbi:hypothetical protein I3843_15G052200 [Carya illinoinensis]|nr:hypothetical protein I3843_15G052200 [Carya illinoinensis]